MWPGQWLQQTLPGVYHIHLDTKVDPLKKLHQQLRQDLGFLPHEFSGHPQGYVHFAPSGHSSIKLYSRAEFDDVWTKTHQIVSAAGADVVGYMEGEYVPTDKALLYRYAPKELIQTPFQIKRRCLDSSRGEKFRQTELHLVCDWNESDPRVINALLDAGLYGALLQKPAGWEALVLTIQGYREDILPLISSLTEYIDAVGGLKRATIKEEIVIKSALFNMTPEELPEIADTVTYR